MEPTTETHKKPVLSVPVAIILAGIIIAGAVYVRGPMSSSRTTNQQFQVENKKTTIRPVDGTDHMLGNPDADLIMVEYSDTECPFCKQFQTSLQRIMKEYGTSGKVAWVYRYFPIEQLHSKALKEAEAVECAAELGGKAKFWDYLDKVFEITPTNNGLDPAQLPIIATELGIDKTAFNNCLASGKYTDKIKESIKEAGAAGGTGTPYTVIIDKKGNTYPIEGAVPYETLKSVIDGLLKGN